MLTLLFRERAAWASPRLLSMLLTFSAILFSCHTVSAETFESDGIYFKTHGTDEVEVTEHPDQVWGYTGTVNIPATVSHAGHTYRVTAIGRRAFADDNYLQQVVLNDNVTVIKESAFEKCTNLVSCSLGKCQVETIEASAFYECECLDNFYLPSSLKRIGDAAFRYCQDLRTLLISDELDLDFVGLHAFDSTYYRDATHGELYLGKCLLKAAISSGEPYEVKEGTTTIAADAFAADDDLEVVNIPASVRCIGENAFLSCTNLSTVNFADESKLEYVHINAFYDTPWLDDKPAGPVYIGKTLYTFKDWESFGEPEVLNVKEGTRFIREEACYMNNFKSIILPNSVEAIGMHAFGYSSVLESVVLPEGLKCLSRNVFGGCEKLREINIPAALETIESMALSRCKSLKKVQLSDRVSCIEPGAFVGSSFLLEIDPANPYYSMVDGVLFTEDQKTLLAFPSARTGDYVIPDEVEDLAPEAFELSQLTSVTVPARLKEINDLTFYGCSLLENVTFKTPSSIKILRRDSFSECTSLKSIVLPDSLVEIHTGTLSGCTSLDSITFPETLQLVYNFWNSAFNSTPWSDKQPDGVVYTGKLAMCVYGKRPEVIEIKEGTLYLNLDFLEDDKVVKKVILPASLQRIGKGALSGCSALTEIIGGTDAVAGYQIFRNTPWYKAQAEKDSIIYYGKNAIGFIPADDGQSRLVVKEGTEYLNFGVYENKSDHQIASLQLPKSLKKIGERGLSGISSLQTLTSLNPVPPVFEGNPWCTNEVINTNLRVLDTSAEAYRNALGWNFFNYIDPIPQLSIENAHVSTAVHLSAHDGHIQLAGVEAGTLVQVFDVQGRLVHQGTETLIRVPSAGLYIVRVAGQSHKIVVTD